MALLALSKIAIQDKEVNNQYSSLKLTNQSFAGVLKSCLKSRVPFFRFAENKNNFCKVRYVKPQI